jgi:hypothetical protein
MMGGRSRFLVALVALTALLPGAMAGHLATSSAARPAAATAVPLQIVTATSTASATPIASATSMPSASATASPTATVTPTNTPIPTDTPVPTATATARPLSFGALARSIVYDDGREIVLIPATGTGRVGLAFLSPSPFPFKKPRFAGYQFIYYNNGFFLGDIYGHHSAVVPPLAPGELVYDAWPSPDGQYIAWQMVARGPVEGLDLNMAASRIVLTDPTGGNARTLLQQNVGGGGEIPIIYGWRPGAPPTLLVQDSYGGSQVLGMHKGLEEFNPALDDLVGDYLPPLGENTEPTGEVLGISPTGHSIVYATSDVHLPSGEGPFPAAISAMSVNGRHVSAIDVASAHHDKATKRWPVPRAYIFYRGAYISPDDTRLAYTRLDILYPPGAITPVARPIACLANLDGTGKVDFGPDERVEGWIDGHTVLVQKFNSHENGLYAVDVTTATTTRLVLGNNLHVDGLVP